MEQQYKCYMNHDNIGLFVDLLRGIFKRLLRERMTLAAVMAHPSLQDERHT
jgi:hypothetical protein